MDFSEGFQSDPVAVYILFTLFGFQYQCWDFPSWNQNWMHEEQKNQFLVDLLMSFSLSFWTPVSVRGGLRYLEEREWWTTAQALLTVYPCVFPCPWSRVLQGFLSHWETQLLPGRQDLKHLGALTLNPGTHHFLGLIEEEDILTPLVLWRMMFSSISISWSLRCQSIGTCHCPFLLISPKSKYVLFLGLIIEWCDEDRNISWACFSVPQGYWLGFYNLLKGKKLKLRTF